MTPFKSTFPTTTGAPRDTCTQAALAALTGKPLAWWFARTTREHGQWYRGEYSGTYLDKIGALIEAGGYRSRRLLDRDSKPLPLHRALALLDGRAAVLQVKGRPSGFHSVAAFGFRVWDWFADPRGQWYADWAFFSPHRPKRGPLLVYVIDTVEES